MNWARSVGFLDVLSSTPAESAHRVPSIHARLRRLATKPGEKYGLGICRSGKEPCHRFHGFAFVLLIRKILLFWQNFWDKRVAAEAPIHLSLRDKEFAS